MSPQTFKCSLRVSASGISVGLLIGVLFVCGCRPEREHRSEIRAHEQVKRQEPITPRRALRGMSSNVDLSSEERAIVLARGDGIRITVGDLVDTLAELPLPLRIRYRERAKWEELLKDLVAFEILVRASDDKGHGRDPLVLLAYKKELIKESLNAAAAEKVTPGDISDAEIVEAYENRREFSEVPKMLHAFVLSTETQEKVDAVHTKLLEVVQDSDRVLARLKDLIPTYGASELAVGNKGDAGYITIDGMGTKQGRKVQMVPNDLAKALFGADGAGSIVGPMHTHRGFMISLVVDVRSGHRRPLDEVRLDIRNVLLQERRAIAREALENEVVAEANVSVDRKAFEAAFPRATSPKNDGAANAKKPKYRLNIPLGVGPAKVKRVPNSRLHELGKEHVPKPGEVSP